MVVSFSVSFPFVPKLFVLSAFMPPIATLSETNTSPGPSHAVYGSSPNLPALGPTNTYYFSSPVPTLLGQLCMQGSDSFLNHHISKMEGRNHPAYGEPTRHRFSAIWLNSCWLRLSFAREVLQQIFNRFFS